MTDTQFFFSPESQASIDFFLATITANLNGTVSFFSGVLSAMAFVLAASRS